jgi:hypothetical protein
VIVAPPAFHADTGEVVGTESYLKRMWCRAEQFCYAVKHGAADNNMWLAVSEERPQLVDAQWLNDGLMVRPPPRRRALPARGAHVLARAALAAAASFEKGRAPLQMQFA